MKLFDVYPLFDLNIVKGAGCKVYDEKGEEYLDLYGGHAVISIGHAEPTYVKAISDQVAQLGFYSNSVVNRIQEQLAERLGELSGYEDYSLFVINSGAEANENALKLASFDSGRKRVLAFEKAFHGRTSAAVRVTDNPAIVAPVNSDLEVNFIPLNDVDSLRRELEKSVYCAVIIEGIQGVGGIKMVDDDFFREMRALCDKTGTAMIVDEIQSGYGRSGKFFAHQYAGVRPDLITIAKGMGNGFPIGGVLISPKFKAVYGMLGTTFGGNHLGCAGALAVLQVMKEQNLIENAARIGEYLMTELKKLPQIKDVRGKGLMIGIEFEQPIKEIRSKLLFDQKVFTGVTGGYVIRLLPPLSLSLDDAKLFIDRFKAVIG